MMQIVKMLAENESLDFVRFALVGDTLQIRAGVKESKFALNVKNVDVSTARPIYAYLIENPEIREVQFSLYKECLRVRSVAVVGDCAAENAHLLPLHQIGEWRDVLKNHGEALERFRQQNRRIFARR